MSGSRAVGLGLGAVALITFALAASLVYNSLVLRKRPEAPQGTISKAFLASRAAAAQTVTGLDRLLPAGMPEAAALKRLAAEGFACTFEPHAATCFRTAGAGRATDIWTIWLTFDPSETLTSSQGERRSAKL